jgi:asparagine synthetase B (glutamine-hydrolysing)
LPPAPYVLKGVELATALVYGHDRAASALRVDEPTPPPRAVLESLLLESLLQPPCIVGFSGGRDSSALLALACDVARRHGLESPVAATNVFPGDVQSAESEWQDLLIRHVGVTAWERLEFTDGMDVVGPVATPLLKQFGPTFPFNGHFGMPSIKLASGGTYLTGIGGDELFEANELTRLAIVLTGGLRPRPADLRTSLRLVAPERLRARHWRRLIPPEPWLRPEVSRIFMQGLATYLARQRLWFSDQVLLDVWPDRARAALQQTLTAFAATVSAIIRHPFQDPRFLRSVAAHTGRASWHGRGAAMKELFGDVLPAAVVRRQTKATFDTIFFNEYSREFVRDWDGQGVDGSLVDVDELRAAWRRPSVDPRSLSLLQAAWCFSRGDPRVSDIDVTSSGPAEYLAHVRR